MAPELFDLDPLVMRFLDKFMNGEFELKEKDGVPSMGGTPCLLLHKLEETNFSCLGELKSSLDSAGAARAVILLGTSGCGKTRTLYTYLSETFGLYFITSARGNGGSEDVKFLTVQLEMEKRLKDGEHRENTYMVTFAVRLLLLARLKIFMYCRAQGITPKNWMLLQVAWRGFSSKGGELLQDVFSIQLGEIYKRIDWNRWTDISSDAVKYLDGLCQQLGKMPDILLDEAQQLLVHYEKRDFFVSADPSRAWRSLARDFMGALLSPTVRQTNHRLVVAGVALPLTRAMEEITSGVFKTLTDLPKAISPFGVWDLSSMVAFIKLSVRSYDPEDLPLVEKYVFPLFRGRYRFLATALEIKLRSGKSLREAADLVRDVVGLPVEKASEKAGFPFAKTMYESIVQVEHYPDLIERCGSDCNECQGAGECTTRVKLISYLERSTAHYFLRRESYFITESEAVNKLIEAGVARTRPEGSGAIIDEFLVLQAYLTHRGGLRWLRDVAMDQVVQTTTCTGKGDMYQQLVGLCFLHMWRRHKEQLSVIFKEVIEDPACPMWLRKELDGQVTLLEGICPLQLSKSRKAAREEFLEAPEDFPNESSLLIRDEDIVGRGRHADGRYVEFGIQAKFLEDEMGDAKLREALDACTARNWNAETTIFLGFLVVYPRQRGKCKFTCGRNPGDPRSFELIITVGEENASLLFSPREMQRISHEKPHRDKKLKRTVSF